ncbi:FAD binding domain-containing protein [Lacrimispora sp. 210928-DFI.3.58]|uniref:FAD binding domain-containing protein n=1 Tax=Lacrimispora sp. 210928-DFI.3.58 TaxID=2883214 RepID=UPI0015B6C264|nr:FAD binding domain-containing protein [Lacrimispora sp. 210928-DFI.3.58]MCB7318586.1 FAD binding domain-containing protein [Lacrimispora sp. 210928-DFI.3.58]
MFRADDYVKVENLGEAYELCQKRSSLVVGGMVWMKMTNITKRTIVDLSGLGLDRIEETADGFSIGCMCTLRQLEKHEGLNSYFNGIFKECTKGIVGVQMRNCATVGGSIYSRFGFSDILTCMMALDTYVELYHEGRIPLTEFAARPVRRDGKDILVRIVIKKDGRRAAYASQRNSKTDFPLIACCVSRLGSRWFVAIGARPAKARLVCITEDDFDTLPRMAKEAADSFTYGSNIRGSGEYRRTLAAVYTRRLMESLTGRSVSRS